MWTTCATNLKSTNGRALEAQVSLEVLSNFTHKALEWQFANQQLSWLLIAADFPESDCSRSVPVWLLYTTCWRCTFASSLCRQLLARSLSTSWLTSGLLCTCHRSVLPKSKTKSRLSSEFWATPVIQLTKQSQLLYRNCSKDFSWWGTNLKIIWNSIIQGPSKSTINIFYAEKVIQSSDWQIKSHNMHSQITADYHIKTISQKKQQPTKNSEYVKTIKNTIHSKQQISTIHARDVPIPLFAD